jgi:hypothetical protein
MLGIGAPDEAEEAAATEPAATAPAKGDARAARLEKARGRKDRPPLVDVPPEQGQSVEDVLAAREAGDMRGARQILATIDRGAGLRTVLRAAAALEAEDEDELRPLLAATKAEAEGYRIWLQIAAAASASSGAASPYLERAAAAGAPAWALAWARALSEDATARREGLVELLFADAPLARTVAARDLSIQGAVPDAEAMSRYAAFAHGRDSIRRFGAQAVAAVVERAVAS